MTYRDGRPDHAYWPQSVETSTRRNRPENQLAWLVALFGLATYLVSFAVVPPGDMEWGVRFSALAAIVAALGLMPRQRVHTRLMVALAVMGLLEALSRCVSHADSQNLGWATIVIVVLNALQGLAAIAALLTQLKVVDAPARPASPYPGYGYYAQAPQQYYAANPQQSHQQPAQAQATAHAAAVASHAQQSTAERDALYAEYVKPQQPGANPAASSSPHSGGLGQPAPPASSAGMPTTGAADSIRPDSGTTAGGSAAQSF